MNAFSCNSSSLPYGGSPYGSAPYGSSDESASSHLIHILYSDEANGTLMIESTTSGISCKYLEKLIFLFNSPDQVEIVGTNSISADAGNHFSCHPAPTVSMLNQHQLSGKYTFKNSENGLILISHSDAFCATYGFDGAQVVIDLVKN
jgi:hypothetical protein